MDLDRTDLASPESLREAAAQLREDAAGCWGIRRKMNLRAAAKRLDAAAMTVETLGDLLAIERGVSGALSYARVIVP